MHLFLLLYWGIGIAWLLVVSLVSFFIIGPHFPGRGATPLAGALVQFGSAEHARQLAEYRALCESKGESLVWWRIVRIWGAVGVPYLLVGVAVSLWATR